MAPMSMRRMSMVMAMKDRGAPMMMAMKDRLAPMMMTTYMDVSIRKDTEIVILLDKS